MTKQIKKVFADGIKAETIEEETQIRKSAYCLSLGFSKQFLEEHQTPLYESLLKASNDRNEEHKVRMEEFKRD